MDVDGSEDEMEDGNNEWTSEENVDLSEANLERFLKDKKRMCKVLHGEHAVECAKLVQIFNASGTWQTNGVSSSITACDITKLASWKEAMKHINNVVCET